MKKNRILSIAVSMTVLSFSFVGLVHVPMEDLVEGFSMMKTVMPYPGKTVIVINRLLTRNPLDHSSPAAPADKSGKRNDTAAAIIFYVLSSLLYNEKTFLILVLLMAGIFCAGPLRDIVGYGEVCRPPDISYFHRWRLKFITPVEKCVKYLASKYDINPILRDGWAETALKKPALCYAGSRVRAFFMGSACGMFIAFEGERL